MTGNKRCIGLTTGCAIGCLVVIAIVAVGYVVGVPIVKRKKTLQILIKCIQRRD